MFGADVIPDGDGLISDKAIADILDDLRNWVHQKNFGGGFGSGGNHSDGVNDGDSVKKCLNTNVPDGSDVTIFDVNGAE